MTTSISPLNIEQTVDELKRDIESLKLTLQSSSKDVSLECLDKILELQNKAILVQKILVGASQLEAQIICDATCTFCEKAIAEIGRTGCANKSKCKNSKCKVQKLFNGFYSLFS